MIGKLKRIAKAKAGLKTVPKGDAGSEAERYLRPLLETEKLRKRDVLHAAQGVLKNPDARKQTKAMFDRFKKDPKFRKDHPRLFRKVPDDPLSLDPVRRSLLVGKVLKDPELLGSARSVGHELLKSGAVREGYFSELGKIADSRECTGLFTSLDKLANSMMGYPPNSSVGAGAANVPGMSIHCLKCGQKTQKGMKKCPKCGNDISQVAENNGGRPKDVDEGDTGADAAEAEGLQDESLESGTAATMSDSGKTAAVAAGLHSAARMLPPEVAATLALGGGGYGGVKLHQFMKKVDETPEQRRRRLMVEHQRRSMKKQGSAGKKAVLNIRAPFKLSAEQVDGVATPSKAFKRMSRKARRSRSYVARAR